MASQHSITLVVDGGGLAWPRASLDYDSQILCLCFSLTVGVYEVAAGITYTRGTFFESGLMPVVVPGVWGSGTHRSCAADHARSVAHRRWELWFISFSFPRRTRVRLLSQSCLRVWRCRWEYRVRSRQGGMGAARSLPAEWVVPSFPQQLHYTVGEEAENKLNYPDRGWFLFAAVGFDCGPLHLLHRALLIVEISFRHSATPSLFLRACAFLCALLPGRPALLTPWPRKAPAGLPNAAVVVPRTKMRAPRHYTALQLGAASIPRPEPVGVFRTSTKRAEKGLTGPRILFYINAPRLS